MAKLLTKPYPLPEITATGDWTKDSAAHLAAFKAITDPILKFPRADGYAMYRVVSVKPPVLQWIPFMDRWQVEPALIRGLRAADIARMIEQDARMRALFSRREA